MKEIVAVHVGQCGVRVGVKFWEQVASEDEIDFSGSIIPSASRCPSSVYLNERPDGKYEPRAVLIDLDSTSLDEASAGPLGRLLNPDNYIGGKSGTGNNWAQGAYVAGANLLDKAFESIRKESEKCDKLAGFQMTHALGGGTGSGMGSRLAEKFREYYCCDILQGFTVFPSPGKSDTVLEPYNTILSLGSISQYVDQLIMLDNEALKTICNRHLQPNPTYSHMNRVIASAMTGITACHRFPGQPSAGLRKLGVNLSPYYPYHYFVTGYAPISVEGHKCVQTVPELVEELFDPRNLMCSVDPRTGVYITAAAITRGAVSMQEMTEQFDLRKDKWSPYFVSYLPDRVQCYLSNVPPPGLKLSGIFLANNTAVQNVFKRVLEKFRAMYKRRAYTHLYLDECGMDQMEFTEAECMTQDIIDDYQKQSQINSEET